MITRKMSKNKVPYTLYDLGGGIFVALVPSRFDLAMLFLRAQEFYESNNRKFKGKNFDVMEYMQWYAKTHEERFSYPQDWVGFNLPGEVLEKCMDGLAGCHVNFYDKTMLDILSKIRAKRDDKFCLLGIHNARDLNFKKPIYGTVLGHEIAHALFYLNKSYRKQVLSIVKNIPAEKLEQAYKYLGDLGYNKKVFDDEVQAYMVSQYGTSPEIIPIHWQSGAKISKHIFKQVVDLFNLYNPVRK